MSSGSIDSLKILNFNVGVLGHVDSGKTSLSKALSTIASTAAFDKNPQSKERGITLDLGFSSFLVELPNHLASTAVGFDKLQVTLVDCPGHASLIKTIIGKKFGKLGKKAFTELKNLLHIYYNSKFPEDENVNTMGGMRNNKEYNEGKCVLMETKVFGMLAQLMTRVSLAVVSGGAQIIDMMILVIDVVKGMQTQTAECLVIGEILCEKMIVVLNKVDLVPESKREATIEKMKKRMAKTLEATKFKDCPVIAVAAKPGGPDAEGNEVIGLDCLISCLKEYAYLPKRDTAGPFLFSVDHCFSIRGQGTVMTGTVLQGTVNVNDNAEISALKVVKKVKSMQMFRKPVKSASQGDRVGICVTQFDPKSLERGLVCAPGYLPVLYGAIVEVHKIPYFKGNCATKSKFHITVGHETVMARLQFFGLSSVIAGSEDFKFEHEYIFQDELSPDTAVLAGKKATIQQFVILEFEHPITCPKDSLVIGSKFDTDINLNTCRLAFHGKICVPFTGQEYVKSVLPQLKIFKTKEREGVVERMHDNYNVVVKSLFKKETNLELFANMKVTLSTGEEGRIEGGFGQSGKIKVYVSNGLAQQTKERLSAMKKGKGKKNDAETIESSSEPVKVLLKFKKYVYDAKHRMIQS